MSNYRRAKLPGATYFITQVTHHRLPWLITDIGREALRTAIVHVRQKQGDYRNTQKCLEYMNVVRYATANPTYRMRSYLI